MSEGTGTADRHGWRSGPVIALGVVVMAAGFGQFGAVAALGDVAAHFGETSDGATIADRAGLSGSALGFGLGAIRLASLVSLPLAALADHAGRRRTVLAFCAIGLGLVVAASASPTYWWFVAIFAFSRPLLTATDTIAEVAAAEETASSDRAKALALVAAAYGIGSGLTALTRGVAADVLGFRGLFLMASLPLVAVMVAQRWVSEPARWSEGSEERPLPVIGAVERRFRRRLLVMVAVIFAISVVTGPGNSFLFVYAENVLDLAPSTTAALVIAAGVSGLAGLLAGRWAADAIGRRVTAALALTGVALAGVATYSGSAMLLWVGYLTAIGMGSMFAPAFGALATELFPTEVRAAVAGWTVAAGVVGASVGLVAFGAVADVGNQFSVAALWVFLPAVAVTPLLALVPETRGRELEEWAGP